jgi:hypothetical protein
MVPKCKASTASTVPYSAGGATMLATTKLKPGTVASVNVETQSGSTPGLGISYTVQ